MTEFEYNRYMMAGTVINFCNQNIVALSTLGHFADEFDLLKALFSQLEDALKRQGNSIKGISMMKYDKRKEVEDAAHLLSHSLMLIAQTLPAAELTSKAYFSVSTLRLASGNELTGIAARLTNVASGYMPQLAAFGIDGAWMTDFGNKTAAFIAMIEAPQVARKERKKATEEVKRLFPELMTFLSERFDMMMTYFRYHDAPLWQNYMNVRKQQVVAVEKPALKGKVTDTEGNPLKGLRVLIAGKPSRKSITTAKGNFRFKRISDGNYTLIVKDGRKEVAKKKVTVPTDGEVGIVVGLRIAE